MIATTSMAAYAGLKDLGTRQQQVFDVIETMGSASNEMIAEKLRLPINCITGRTNELSRYGYVKVAGLTRNRSGVSAKLWAVSDPELDKRLKEFDCEG